MRTLLWFLLSTYPLLCLGFFLFHRFFILHPSRGLTRTPADLGLAYTEIFFPAADQVRLHGWYLAGAPQGFRLGAARPVMLFFPGNEGTVSKFVPQMKPWLTAGFDVLLFGYRGFGKSAWRWPTEQGLRKDALGAWAYLLRARGLKPGQIVFYAQSLGCGLASWAAAECNPAALILEGGFSSVPDAAARVVPWLPVRLLTTERFDTRLHLHHVACPVLVTHSVEDRQVPYAEGQALLAAAREPKSFFALHGEHAQALEIMPGEYLEAILSFLRRRAVT
jgi:uncharacterized protein